MRITACTNCSTKHPFFKFSKEVCGKCGKCGTLIVVPLRRFAFRTDQDVILASFNERQTMSRQVLFRRVSYRVGDSSRFENILGQMLDRRLIAHESTVKDGASRKRVSSQYVITEAGMLRLIGIVEEGAPEARPGRTYRAHSGHRLKLNLDLEHDHSD